MHIQEYMKWLKAKGVKCIFSPKICQSGVRTKLATFFISKRCKYYILLALIKKLHSPKWCICKVHNINVPINYYVDAPL